MSKLSETHSDAPDLGGMAGPHARAVDRRCLFGRTPAFVERALLAAVGCTWIALAAGDLRGQFLEPDSSFKSKKVEVQRIMREDKVIPPGEQQMFDDFFRLYLIPQFAAKENFVVKKEAKAPEPKEGETAHRVRYSPSGLPKLRAELRTQYFAQSGIVGGPPHQRANQLALDKFTKEILRIKAPPGASSEVQGQVAAIKVNAVLAIGEMNDQEQTNGVKAKPLPQALTALLTIFNAKVPDNKALVGSADALRFAAVVGIQRHVDSDTLTPEARGAVVQSMLTAAQQKQAPEGRLPATQNALRRRAALTLGMLGDLGPNGSVVKALNAVVGDASEPAKVRADFAAALGMFKPSQDAKVDFKAVGNNIGWLLIDVGRPETIEAGEKEEPAAWRRFRTCLRDGLEGLTLAVSVTDPAQRQFVDAIQNKAKLIDKTLDNKKLDNTALAKKVTEQLKELEAVLEPRPAAPKGSDTLPVAPAPKKTGTGTSAVASREGGAVVNTPPKSPAVRPKRVDSVSVDQRATDDKPGKTRQEIEPAADEDEKAAAP